MSSWARKKHNSSSVTSPLLASVRNLSGIGPERENLLEKLGIKTIADLILYPPRRYIDRKSFATVGDLVQGETQTVVGRVLSVKLKRTGRRSLTIATIADST